MFINLKPNSSFDEEKELIINSEDISSMQEMKNPINGKKYTELVMRTGKIFYVKQTLFEIDYLIHN